jgi:RNA polymerase sigma-70 factor (ECF subfamily)
MSFVLQLRPFRHRCDGINTFSTGSRIVAHDFQAQLIQFLPKMRVWALALTRNRAAAEDLTQDVATKALAARDCFTPGTNFSAWVHRIMVNHFISSVRSRREYTDVDSMPDMPVPASHEDRTALRELGWALDRLPRDQREALQMIVLQEQSYEDAAQRTGCAIGTLKSRVHRARLQLRAFLTGEPTADAA